MQPYYTDEQVTLYHGDALAVLRDLPSGSVDCCVTSPPYFGLRDYGIDGQYGLEASPSEYVETMRGVFAEVRRVLADDGTLWLNVGDSYVAGVNMTGTKSMRQRLNDSHLRGSTVSRGRPGLPSKNLLGIPWRVAFALQDDGWILRNDIIWAKPNAMPESVTDRLSTRHEHLFLFTKSARYWFDLDAIGVAHDGPRYLGRSARHVNPDRNDGGACVGFPRDLDQKKNPGDVWTIPTQPFAEAHFACMPLALAERCILAGARPGGIALDPFSGSGTTGLAATKHGRRYVGIDLSADYLDLSLRTRFAQAGFDFGDPA